MFQITKRTVQIDFATIDQMLTVDETKDIEVEFDRIAQSFVPVCGTVEIANKFVEILATYTKEYMMEIISTNNLSYNSNVYDEEFDCILFMSNFDVGVEGLTIVF